MLVAWCPGLVRHDAFALAAADGLDGENVARYAVKRGGFPQYGGVDVMVFLHVQRLPVGGGLGGIMFRYVVSLLA